MENKYTSLELSKKLYEAGFKKGSWYVWFEFKGDWILSHDDDVIKYISNKVPAYDILNDLCVKYVDELFSTDMIEWSVDGEDVLMCEHRKVTMLIMMNLQQDNKEKAEEIFIDNCILFKPTI